MCKRHFFGVVGCHSEQSIDDNSEESSYHGQNDDVHAPELLEFSTDEETLAVQHMIDETQGWVSKGNCDMNLPTCSEALNEFEACGGDYEGNWEFTHHCLSHAISKDYFVCEGRQVLEMTFSATGHLQINNETAICTGCGESYYRVETIPSQCLEVDCASYESSLNPYSLSVSETTCCEADDGGCICVDKRDALEFINDWEIPLFDPCSECHIYEKRGLLDHGYCVQGNTLLIQQLTDDPNRGPSLLIFQKK